MRTYITKPDHIKRQWWVVDAEGQTLGRLASEVAKVLRGKHKPYYAPNLDCGDFVIVLNADKIHVTGNKLDNKIYYRHSGYPGGIRGVTLREQLAKHPTRAVRKAVWGMLPHNRLGRRMIKKLKIYADSTHPHEAQQPEPMDI
ncbi:MAG: 50S ribosomal protein L13 [Anaerolineae bacterium]